MSVTRSRSTPRLEQHSVRSIAYSFAKRSVEISKINTELVIGKAKRRRIAGAGVVERIPPMTNLPYGHPEISG